MFVLFGIWSRLDSTTFSNDAVDVNAEGILGVPSRLQLNSPRIFRSLLGMLVRRTTHSKRLFIPEMISYKEWLAVTILMIQQPEDQRYSWLI